MNIAPLLSLLLACTGAPTDDSAAPTEVTDPAGDAVCGAWTGFVAGRTWRWAYADNASTQGEWTERVERLDADGAVSLRTDLEQSNGTTTYTSVTDTEYRCDADGLWLLSSHAEWTSTVDGVVGEGWQDAAWEASGPVQPRVLTLDAIWEWAYEYTYTASYGEGSASDIVTYEVESVETIEVPAGTFETLQVFNTTEEGASLRAWVAQDVGAVATESASLVAVYDE